MSKAILVIDVPENCEKCPCAYFTEGAHHDFCQALGYNTNISYENKHLNCPLKPIPEKKEIYNPDSITGYNSGYSKGYNDCIDEILKEE